nr:NIPSNAP family protein [uncultured Sphingomonas sp.]
MRLMLAACSVALAAVGPAIPLPAIAQTQAPDAQTAVYELRIYHPAPGKLAALNARFREHTLKLFAKHGMHNVAYWNEQPTAEAPEGRVVYVLAYPSREAREASWKAFGADPQWRAVVATSEAGGKLVTKIDSVFMTLADYSPRLPLR